MKRSAGWEERLNALFERAQGETYRLGHWDCAIFAALAVEALTGTAPLELAGRYRGRKSMVKLMRAHGHSLRDAVSAVLGAEPVPVRLAWRGDPLLRVDDEAVEHLAVCAGPYGVAPAGRGLMQRGLSDFVLGWSIR